MNLFLYRAARSTAILLLVATSAACSASVHIGSDSGRDDPKQAWEWKQKWDVDFRDTINNVLVPHDVPTGASDAQLNASVQGQCQAALAERADVRGELLKDAPMSLRPKADTALGLYDAALRACVGGDVQSPLFSDAWISAVKVSMDASDLVEAPRSESVQR